MVKCTCEYCNTTFSDKSNLLRHQKRARYCLEIQGLERGDCRCICGKVYSRNDNLQRHQVQCRLIQNGPVTPFKSPGETNKEDILLKVIDKYGEMVKDLQKQITELATNRQVTNHTNNNRNMVMNNLQPITDADLHEHLEHLSLNFIQEGAKGYADFAGNYPFKDKVMCTDRSRRKIKYKNEDGDLTDDGRILAQRFFQAISERNTEILNQAYANLHHEIQDIVSNNRAGEVDVTGILNKATALQNILIKSQKAALGEDDEFAQEFLSHLSKMF